MKCFLQYSIIAEKFLLLLFLLSVFKVHSNGLKYFIICDLINLCKKKQSVSIESTLFFFSVVSYLKQSNALNFFQYMLDLPFQRWLSHCFNLIKQGLQKLKC